MEVIHMRLMLKSILIKNLQRNVPLKGCQVFKHNISMICCMRNLSLIYIKLLNT